MSKLAGLKKRTITGIILVLIVTPLVYIKGPYFFILGLCLSMIASWEMMNMYYTKAPSLRYLRFIVPVFSGLIVTMVYLSTTKGFVLDPSLSTTTILRHLLYHFWIIVILILAIIFIFIAIIFTKDSTAYDMANTVLTLIYCGLIMGYVIAIKYVKPITTTSIANVVTNFSGGRNFAYLYAIVIGTDVMAYLIGSKFGKRKLCPNISPNKSVEGAAAGLISGGFIGTVCIFLFKMVDVSKANLPQTIFIILIAFFASIILSFTVQIGDLVASKMKRTYQIKDFGKIFPGHGGVLDRFDSLIFAGGSFYIMIQFIQMMIIGVR